MSLLVVGTMAFDSIETPFGKRDKTVGGAATFICYAASNFTNDINAVSVIGEDFPLEILAELNSKGVKTDGVQRKMGEKSFFWAGKYHNDMNSRDTLATELNVLADFDPVLPENYKNSDIVLLGNLTPTVQMRVLDQMNQKPKLVILDTMNFWMDIMLDELKEVLKRVDVLTINDEEARQLSGEYSLRKAARKILTMGPKFLMIKKGEHGALLFHEDHFFFCPALPLEEVVDPTGAGDSFAGGFAGYLAQTGDVSYENMKKAVVYGSATASFSVEKFGIDGVQQITAEHMRYRLMDFQKMMHSGL